jgi:hypothetical protein
METYSVNPAGLLGVRVSVRVSVRVCGSLCAGVWVRVCALEPKLNLDLDIRVATAKPDIRLA